jgi:hypothetical protein
MDTRHTERDTYRGTDTDRTRTATWTETWTLTSIGTGTSTGQGYGLGHRHGRDTNIEMDMNLQKNLPTEICLAGYDTHSNLLGEVWYLQKFAEGYNTPWKFIYRGNDTLLACL